MNEAGKYSLMNDITRWRSFSGVPRGCVNRIDLWPLRRDDHSGVLIGQCSPPAHVHLVAKIPLPDAPYAFLLLLLRHGA